MLFPLSPLFQLTALLSRASCPGGHCGAPAALPSLAFLVAPVLLAWTALGARDVYCLALAQLAPPVRRLAQVSTGLRVIAGFLLAVGALSGITSEVAPAMLAAAAALVVGSTWFDARARAAAAGPTLIG